MIIPIRLNDHYFISWLHIVKHIDYNIVNNNVIVYMKQDEYNKFLLEYEDTHKPLLREIRKTIKLLNNLIAK